MAPGDPAGASSAIAERLAQSDAGNAIFQRDLTVAHAKLAEAGSAPRAQLDAALRIALSMQKRGVLAPADAFIPRVLRRRLAAVAAESR